MSDGESDEIVEAARRGMRECAIEVLAFRRRLALLEKTNWITIVAPALLSTLAGASIFQASATAGESWKWLTGGAALLSALLVAIHKARNCDFYQSECRRLIQEYDCLATKYRTLSQVDILDPQQRLEDLELELATVRKHATIGYPASYKTEAEKSFEATTVAAAE